MTECPGQQLTVQPPVGPLNWFGSSYSSDYSLATRAPLNFLLRATGPSFMLGHTPSTICFLRESSACGSIGAGGCFISSLR